MDGTTIKLKEKLDQLLREAAEVSVTLDRVEGIIVGVPHYSVIESRAHELGQQLSRRIQAQLWVISPRTLLPRPNAPGVALAVTPPARNVR
jgi:predicted aconitase